jgi:hypothetical protein
MRWELSISKCAVVASLACGLAACATGRKDLGYIDVAATPPRVSTQVIDDYTFHVTEGRIALESPGNPTAFDLTEEADGCLRGNVDKAGDLQEICRLPASKGEAPGPAQWKSALSSRRERHRRRTDARLPIRRQLGEMSARRHKTPAGRIAGASPRAAG